MNREQHIEAILESILEGASDTQDLIDSYLYLYGEFKPFES